MSEAAVVRSKQEHCARELEGVEEKDVEHQLDHSALGGGGKYIS